MTQPITFNKYIASIYRQSKHDFNEQIAALDLRATTGDLLLFVADHPGLHNGNCPSNGTDPSLSPWLTRLNH